LAKKPDHRVNDLEADNTGGVLSGLLADEDDLDRRALWRLGSWGLGAVGAVILAVMANQSSLGIKRDQVASADLGRQSQQIQTVARETQNEARRLASAIDTLNSDRDRLYSRVTSLEQGLDSVTGAIIRQSSAGASPAASEPQAAKNQASAPAVAAVASSPATAPVSDKSTAAAEPGPATVSAVTKDAPKTDIAKPDTARPDTAKPDTAKADISKSETSKADLAKTDLAKPDSVKADTAKPDTAKTETVKAEAAKPEAAKASPATPLVAAKSIMAPPDPAAGKLIEPNKAASTITASPIPEVVAAASSADDAEGDDTTAPKVVLQRTEFGVDLGGANSVNGLRALWRGLLKSRSNEPLIALRPIIVVKEGTNGLGLQLRLVAGPLNDAGAAARICAVLTENHRSCETAIFDGQRLSVKSDDLPQSTAKPVSRRRNSPGKRAAAVVEEPPKKPETSTTLSSFFGRKGS
jgi:hypothetical protein